MTQIVSPPVRRASLCASDVTARILDICDAHTTDIGVPMIVNQAEPRYLGQVSWERWNEEADRLLLAHRISATYLSRGEIHERYFVIAHG